MCVIYKRKLWRYRINLFPWNSELCDLETAVEVSCGYHCCRTFKKTNQRRFIGIELYFNLTLPPLSTLQLCLLLIILIEKINKRKFIRNYSSRWQFHYNIILKFRFKRNENNLFLLLYFYLSLMESPIKRTYRQNHIILLVSAEQWSFSLFFFFNISALT